MLAIAGGKGGCGKTTTALGLAHAVARIETAVPLVADADVEMPDLHVVADVPRTPGLAALARGGTVDVAAHPARLSGVRAVPVGGIDGAALARALARLRAWSGPLFVDCPAGAARDAVRPLRAADRTLLVATPTRQCLRDTAKTAAMARTLDAPPVGVVLSCARVGAECAVPAEAVRSLFECPLLGRIPPVETRPLHATAVRSAYEQVAKNLNERNL